MTPDDSPEDSPDYLREIERAFAAGGPLVLTPADWEVARGWEKRGIPLSVALSGIAATLARPGAVTRRSPLRVCSPAVNARFAALRRQHAGAPAARSPEPAADESSPDLHELAESLARWAPPFDGPPAAEARAAANEAAAAVRSLAGVSPNEIESRLATIQTALLDRLEAAMPPDVKKKARADAERALAAYRGRMPEAEWEGALATAIRRRVAETLALPAFTVRIRTRPG